MSRGTNQKFKYNVTAERKSIYADFQDMTDMFGVEIIKEQIGRETEQTRGYVNRAIASDNTVAAARFSCGMGKRIRTCN